MLRAIAAVIVAVVSWFVIATVANLGLRLTWHDYAQVERAMNFTLTMLLARLLLGTMSSLGAGFVGAWISHSNRLAALSLVGLLPASFPADALPALAAISGLVPPSVLRFPDSDSATGREAVHGSRSNLCPADAELTTARLNLSRADRKR